VPTEHLLTVNKHLISIKKDYLVKSNGSCIINKYIFIFNKYFVGAIQTNDL